MFSFVFALALLLTLGMRMYLASRQIRHIAGHRAAVPADFSEHISLQAHQKAADYSISRTRLGMLALALDAVVILGFTLLGGLQFIDTGIQSNGGSALGSIGSGLILMGAVALVSSVIELPLSWYRQFVLEARFGFNRMTPRLFWTDWIKGMTLGAVIGAPLLWVVLSLMESAGSTWWLYAWGVWTAFSLLIMVLYPSVIAPLFNKFTPMETGDMRSRIENLMRRCGFSPAGLFVMDGSRRSAHGNAYFTGFGKAKRIVFFDTLLQRLSPAQIEAVLAHELGHFSKRHVLRHLLLSIAMSGFTLWLLSELMQRTWFYTGLGVTPRLLGDNNAMALLLFFMVMPFFTFPLKPLMAALSRRHEYEADAYAAEQTNAEDLVSALVRLYEDNASTLTPDPLHSLFYDSHPPASLRIAHLRSLPSPSAGPGQSGPSGALPGAA